MSARSLLMSFSDQQPTQFELLTNMKTVKAPWASPSAVAASAGGSGLRVNRRAFVTGLGAVLAASLAAEVQEASRRHWTKHSRNSGGCQRARRRVKDHPAMVGVCAVGVAILVFAFRARKTRA